jgi:hypothetical protein
LRKSDSDSEPKQQHHEDSLTSNSFFRSAADQLYSQQQRKQRLSTGSQHLDDLLSGGLELGEITQFYGAPTAGKTHLCHFFCVILSSCIVLNLYTGNRIIANIVAFFVEDTSKLIYRLVRHSLLFPILFSMKPPLCLRFLLTITL